MKVAVRYRRLGKTGLEVSELGYGAWGIGKTMWLGAEDDESLRALRRAIELGVNCARPGTSSGTWRRPKPGRSRTSSSRRSGRTAGCATSIRAERREPDAAQAMWISTSSATLPRIV